MDLFDELSGIPPQTLKVVGPPLANWSKNPYLQIESALDVQYITGVAINASTAYWTAAETGDAFAYITSLWNSSSSPTFATPLVNSFSFGGQEPSSFDDRRVAVMNRELMKLGTHGITVVAASGDTGALGLNFRCEGNPETPGYFLPSFPATSPYITAVGATAILGSGPGVQSRGGTLPPLCKSYECTDPTRAEEIPAITHNSQFTSGGGFSAVFSRPKYQESAVATYLQTPVLAGRFPPSEIWNHSNRAIPDISTIGQNVLMINGSAVLVNGGTSASAPIFAGLLTLVNDFLLHNHKPPVGFVNPLLYQMAVECPTCFNGMAESTVGEYEDNCSNALFSCCAPVGFLSASVSRGRWDPLTGLGSPHLPSILAYLRQLHSME